MGAELAQRSEWAHEGQLEWHLMSADWHHGVWRLLRDLNSVYAEEPALHELDCDPGGFEWAIPNDSSNSVIAFFRKSGEGDLVLVVHNMTPVPRQQYRIGVPASGLWKEIINSDAEIYGGSGMGNLGGVGTGPLAVPHGGRPHSIDLVLPPLGTLILKLDSSP
jgi:1,4-alpha-glucan branching enzyme